MPDDSEPAESDATVAFGPGKERPPELDIPGYRILSRLGQGGMGAVYLGEDLQLGRRVAIKVVADAIVKDAAIRARFLREARLLATVEHPNVVRVYSFGASDARAYLIMEHVEGETLADRIRGGPMPLTHALKIVVDIIDALDAAWDKRIIHRDIKPSNILFDRRGSVKVADFGLAKGGEASGSDSSLTQTGYLLGSPHYVSPEQAQGREADFRADIYSLGVTLFELLTSRKPFDGGSPISVISQHLHSEMPSVRKYRGDLPAGAERLVEWMTAKEPSQRPASYAELKEAIAKLDAPAVSARGAENPRKSHGRRAFVGMSLLFFAAAIALLLVFRWRTNHQEAVSTAHDDRLVVAVAPFWGPDPESMNEGRSMAAMIQQQVVTRLGSAAKVIGIDDTKVSVRDPDSARALGEALGASAVIWGQAFALHNEREIQPSLTLVPRKRGEMSTSSSSLTEVRGLSSDLPSIPEAIRVPSQASNQIELRKTSAEGIGDLVTFVAAMYALSQKQPQRALDLLVQTRQTPDALYQKAICLAQMNRDEDAARELKSALTLDPAHASSLAMLADIDARASRFANAANTLRAARATGRRFTTSEAALYHDVLYVQEHYRTAQRLEETATMLAVDPATGHVLDRWELPGVPRVFSVDDAGMMVKCDFGPPRNGELATFHFVDGKFQGPPLAHTTVANRIRRMRPGWWYQINFGRELGTPGVKLPLAHFRYSPIDAEPAAPKTLAELKAALETAIARDPTQPWYRLSLAFTTWELGDHAAANRIVDEMFAQPNRGTEYYEFSWMIRQMEALGHRDWSDRAYAEALKRRRAEPQPAAASAAIERMVDAPFVRRAAFVSQVAPDPPRDRLWLTRARELNGIAWDGGDELAAGAWARYLRAQGDIRGAEEEDNVHKRAHELFGGARMALTAGDIARVAQVAVVVTMLILLIVVWRRNRSVSFAPNERRTLFLLAALLVIASSARLVAASRARLLESVPVPMADNLGHPVIAATLDQILTERDSNDLRFIAAVSHHLAGDAGRAADLYRSIGGDEADENLREINGTPPHFPTTEMLARAFHEPCPDELWQTIKAAWGTRPAPGSLYSVAYQASQTFYVTLLVAAALLALLAGAGRAPAGPFGTFSLALLMAGLLFVILAFAGHSAESSRVKWPVSGWISAQWNDPIAPAYPFPPDPTAEQSMQRAMAQSEAMRLFWISIAVAGFAAAAGGASLLRDRMRHREPRVSAPSLGQPAGETATER